MTTHVRVALEPYLTSITDLDVLVHYMLRQPPVVRSPGPVVRGSGFGTFSIGQAVSLSGGSSSKVGSGGGALMGASSTAKARTSAASSLASVNRDSRSPSRGLGGGGRVETGGEATAAEEGAVFTRTELNRDDSKLEQHRRQVFFYFSSNFISPLVIICFL